MKETSGPFKLTKIQKGLLILTFLSVVGIILYAIYGQEAPIIKKDGTIMEKTTEDGGKIIEVKEVRNMPVEEEFPMDMPDFQVGQVIHQMSHQKIEAEEKWGFLPLTAERVARLKEVVENGDYQNKSRYISILNRWAENDFTQIDKDHNTIWTMQGGTVGRATGILSYEEEKQFIEKYYE
ncbi:DUF6241 domain-containing protein [Paenisporosarcina sp. FSL H8-0542]|uniref:DUF6241 domain-containing protein n=1 Tax=Paenisporosarcina sp. FSL H8-0542 TaxID=2921401 RepID=UPI00315ABDC5